MFVTATSRIPVWDIMDEQNTVHEATANPGIPGCIRRLSRCERIFFMSPYIVILAARIIGTVDENLLR